MTRTERVIFAMGLFGFWLMTLFLPAAKTLDEELSGGDVFVIGWMGPFALQFGWFANLTFFMIIGMTASYSMLKSRAIQRLGVIQSALLLSALFWRALYDDSGTKPITEFGIGYWLWLAIIAFTCIWPFVLNRIADPERGSSE